MPAQCVGLARPEDKAAVDALRLEAFAGAAEFRLLRPDLLAWNPASSAHIVLAGWDADGRLASTFQGIVAASAAEAERILGISVAMEPDCFPTFITGRAATRKTAARSGLNSVLRTHFLRATIAAGFPSTMGLAYTNAPRINTLAAMGYRFFRPDRVWDPEVEPISLPIGAYLRRRDYEAALALLVSGATGAIEAYPWEGPALHLTLPGARP
jgi:hypothetical protein